MKTTIDLSPENVKNSLMSDDLEQKFALLIINTEEPFVLVNTDLAIITFNRQCEKLYQNYFGKQIIKGKPILDYAQKERVDSLKDIYNNVFNGATHQSEINITLPDAENRTILLKYKPAFDENGSVLGAFVSCLDITEIRRSEKLLSISEARYRTLVENGGDAIIIFSLDGVPSYVSPSIHRVIGYSETEALKLNMINLVHPDDQATVQKIMETVLETPGKSLPDCKVRVLHKDGTWHWYDSIVTNMLHEPLINGLVSNLRDITEKVKAEHEKEFDHNNLHALINNTHDLMWSVSLDGKIISSNLAFDNMVKHISGETILKGGEAPTKWLSPEELKRWEYLYGRAFSGETFTIEEFTQHPVEYWSEISFYPIHNGDKIIGTACYSRNITDRKLFEKKLQANTEQLLLVKNHLEHNESRLKQAQSIAHVGSWEINFAANTAIWSDEAYRIYGLIPGNYNLSYNQWLSFIHPDDLEGFEREINEKRKTFGDMSYQHRIICADGKLKYVVSESRYEFNAMKEPIGLYGIVHDITERINAEKELLESHGLLKKLTDKVPVVIYQFEMDAAGQMRFPFMSKAVEELVPGADLEVLKTDASSIFASVCEEDMPALIASIEESRIHLMEWRLDFRMRKDNKIRWISGFSRPQLKENGNTVWYGYLQDVTARKESEVLLNDLNESLEKRAKELVISNAELEQFAYIASHDLQEPLRMVTSFLTQLESKYKEKLDDKGRQYIHFATDGAVRMRRLILDLLEYSRVGKEITKNNKINANDLVSETVKLNGALIEEKKAAVYWKDLPIVLGSETSLQQVFNNLIGNALKYQPAGTVPEITIVSTETEDHWHFSISDNGIGIEERYFEKIFVVFQRLHNKDEYSGTGIGLAICKKIIESHHGKIWVESQVGNGTTFHFTISKQLNN